MTTVLLRYLAFGEVPDLPANNTHIPRPAVTPGPAAPDPAWLPPRP